jgi:hypothetical protein
MQNRTLALGLIALSLIPFSAAFMFYERPQDARDTTKQNAKADKTPLVRDYSPVIGPFIREAVGSFNVDIIIDGEVSKSYRLMLLPTYNLTLPPSVR